jgi:RNA polymerase sigma-70 factor (ECF subfamily)
VEITRYLISRGSKPQDAEDTVQDTIVKMLTLNIFISPDKLRAYMYRVSIREYINKYHRAQHYQTILEQLGRELIDFAPPDSQLTDLSDVLGKLPSADEALLRAYYYENLSTKQLAERFQFSLAKVKVQLYRARKKLKKILEDDGYGEWEL